MATETTGTVRRVRPLAPLSPFVPDPNREDVWWDPSADATDPTRLEFTPDDFTASLSEWVETTQPPIWHGHVKPPDGTPETQWGRIVGVIRLTEEQAHARGIDSQVGEWLYAEMACNEELTAMLDSGALRGTSPGGLQANYLDHDGRRWPVVLREISFVREPRLRTQPRAEQIDASDLRDTMPTTPPKWTKRARAAKSVTLAKRDGTVLYTGALASCNMSDLPTGEAITMAEGADTIAVTTSEELGEAMKADPATMEDGSDLVEVLTAAMDALPEEAKALARQLLDMLAGVAAAAPMAASMRDAVPANAEIAALKAKLAKIEAERAVESDLSTRMLPPGVTRDELLECSMRDPKAYAIALKAMPAKPQLATERVNLSDQRPTDSVGSSALMANMTIEAAKAHSRGESFDPVDFAKYGARK
jgi:hypothetical protein